MTLERERDALAVAAPSWVNPKKEKPRRSGGSGRARGVAPGCPNKSEQPGAGRKTRYFTVAPTTESHCLVMTSFAWPCCARVGKRALS